MAKRWITYIKLRYPQIIWGSLAFGIALSGNQLNGTPLNLPLLILGFIPIWLFLFLMTLISDFKNLEKDRLANPNYPLPLGLFTPKEVFKTILCLQLFLFAYSELLWVFTDEKPALLLALLTVYSWLFFKDFFMHSLLAKRPFVQTFFAQFFAIPLALFAVSIAQPHRLFSDESWGFAFLLFSAFYVYEICSKLNPKLHPAAATPIQFYGFKKTMIITIIFLLFGAIAALAMNREFLLWPAELIVAATLIATFFHPSTYRIAETAATISLILHAWVGIL